MSIIKNLKAKSIAGIAGYEIIVTGEANVGMLAVMPKLEKRDPQGINKKILQLDLVNAGDSKPENFKPVQYNEAIETQDQYETVEIFYKNNPIERVQVTMD